jgi:hypothetical protein
MNSTATYKTYFLYALAATIVATIGVGITWLIANVISPDIYAEDMDGDLVKLTFWGSLTATLFYCAVAIVVGLVLFFFRRPALWWYVLSVVILILIGINAFDKSDTNESAIWLNIMHIVAAAAMIPGIGRALDLRADAA